MHYFTCAYISYKECRNNDIICVFYLSTLNELVLTSTLTESLNLGHTGGLGGSCNCKMPGLNPTRHFYSLSRALSLKIICIDGVKRDNCG